MPGMPYKIMSIVTRKLEGVKHFHYYLCRQLKGGGMEIFMENRFIRADDVAQELNVSKPYAYKLIRKLNEELKAKGFITIAGRVNRQYFYERLYGAGKEKE